MVSNLFVFSPLFGEDSRFDSYVSNGLKPPISCFMGINQTSRWTLNPRYLGLAWKGWSSEGYQSYDKNTCMCRCAVLLHLILGMSGVSITMVSSFLSLNFRELAWRFSIGVIRSPLTSGPVLGPDPPDVPPRFQGSWLTWEPWRVWGMVDLKDSPLKKVHEVWGW